ncbi:hypothetical protein D9Q98_007565 [Chlorella vulgaris]|uniref:Uncharacterized protein n=1 Tax=Chlorella vulgaris TaxID=3077 RepID=A0A9D4YVM4_CHLVU|nr:hypothetical protein D9Q98_007565 [Chlorella vulgaris]
MARLLAVDKKLSSDSDFEDSPPAKALGKLPRHGSGAAALRQSIEAAAERASAQPHANPDQAAVPAQPFSMFALGASSGLSQTQSHPQQRRAARWGAGSSKQAGGHKRLPAFSSSAGPHVASKKPRHAAVPPGAPPKVKQQQQVLHVNARQQQQQHKPSVRPMKHQRQPTILAPTRIDSSSNDDAVPPASLKQAVSLSRPATRKQAPALKAAQRSGKAGARPTARGGARAASRIAVAAAAAAEEAAFGSRVTLIRLDQGNDLTRWPGWQASAAGVRRVAAYRSAAYAPGSDGGTGTCAKLVRTPDVLGYELSQLGGGFQGLLINLGDGSGLTSQQLEQQQQRLDGRPAAGDGSSVKGRAVLDMLCDRLQLGRDVMSCGLLFIWAAKGQAAAAVRFMTQQGFKYVENLTWLQLGPNNKPLEASPLFRCSHRTLLMGRRVDAGSSRLELRHQRTPDVIASPALCDGQCPEAVYNMIETLLPEAGKAVKPKLLELNLCGGSGSPRPGWIMVVNEP